MCLLAFFVILPLLSATGIDALGRCPDGKGLTPPPKILGTGSYCKGIDTQELMPRRQGACAIRKFGNWVPTPKALTAPGHHAIIPLSITNTATMATATTTKKTRIFYTVQEITREPWSKPVGNRVWTLTQAKRIRTILRKQRRECFLAQIRLYV